jgi:hypothetical protein
MKVENPNSSLWLSYWRHGVSKTSKNLFSCFFNFWLDLLFCRLLWRDLGELVSVMERNHGCSMDILYELCEPWLWWRIGVELSREQGEVERRKIYKVG